MNHVDAQCRWTGDLGIPDNDVVQIDFNIEGLLNNILGFNNGLCQVNVSFSHSSVGDLVFLLTSPAGQQVQLIGPLVNSNDTDFATWSVQFIPCSDATSPDVGIGGVWSNLENWAIFGDYQGTYHPSMGCLEDFNTGSANGQWQLTILDANPLDVGVVTEVELIFCDGTGLLCTNCALNAGSFSNQRYEYCYSSITDESIFAEHPNLPDQTYNHLVFAADTLRDVVDTVRVSNLTPGSYTICGLSVLDIHEYAWDSIAIGDSTILTLVTLERIGACYDYTNRCTQVDILVPPDTIRIDTTFCFGDSIHVYNLWIKNTGVFVTSEPSTELCDSLVIIQAREITIEAEIAQMDSLGCRDEYVLLVGSEFNNQSIIYNWASYGENPIILENDSSIRVAEQDTLRLITSLNGCFDTVFHIVEVKADRIDVDVVIDTVLCGMDSVFGHGITPILANELVWYNLDQNMPIIGEDVKLNVNQSYEVFMGGTVFCSDTTRVNFVFDTIRPVINIQDSFFVCEGGNDTLEYAVQAPTETYFWRSPLGSTVNGSKVIIDETGYYKLTATGLNLCTAVDSIYVALRDTVPYRILVDKFRCDDTTAKFLFSHNGLYDSIFVTDSQLRLFQDSLFTVNQLGEYSIRAIDYNGCEVFQTITLDSFHVVEKPLSYSRSTYTCDSNFVNFGTQLETGMTAEWFDLFDVNLSSESDYKYYSLESIKLISTDINGCQWDTILTALIDTVPPLGGIGFTDELKCQKDTIRLYESTGQAQVIPTWSTQDGQIISIVNDSALVGSSGTYFLTLKSLQNGCETTINQAIESIGSGFVLDTIFITTPRCPNDENGIVQITTFGDFQRPIDYKIINTSDQNQDGLFMDLEVGAYLFEAVDANGCKDSLYVSLPSPILPSLIINKDTVVNSGSSVRLHASLEPNQINELGKWDIENQLLCRPCKDTVIVINQDAELTFEYIDDSGCIQFQSFHVTVLNNEFRVFLPNSFSPNNDGNNDTWQPFFSFEKTLNFDLEIYNRWGGQVYKIAGTYPNLDIRWNGYANNELLPSDMYVYKLIIKELSGQSSSYQGEISLIR